MTEIGSVAMALALGYKELTTKDLENMIKNEWVNSNTLYIEIKEKLDEYLKNFNLYISIETHLGKIDKALKGLTIFEQSKFLETQKELIYRNFFDLQNLINAYMGQMVILTYVHVDDNGRREVRLSDNTIDHLQAIHSWKNDSGPLRLSYVVQNHYAKLQNSLSNKNNDILQKTAAEVEGRYMRYDRFVLWNYGGWKGYKFESRGPINEAFVAIYVHNIKLSGMMEQDIDFFVLNPKFGAINADNAAGTLIGDVRKNGVQFAVKGDYASPQGFMDITKDFQELQKNFSAENLYKLIEKWTVEEEERAVPQIKKMTEDTLNEYINKYEKTFKKRGSYILH